jgi:hypothetical protein
MEQCFVCGEVVLDGWDHCPACGHPYPVGDDDDDELGDG